jgi:hypothetical protein
MSWIRFFFIVVSVQNLNFRHEKACIGDQTEQAISNTLNQSLALERLNRFKNDIQYWRWGQ